MEKSGVLEEAVGATTRMDKCCQILERTQGCREIRRADMDAGYCVCDGYRVYQLSAENIPADD